MNCSRCGAEVQPSWKACPSCGLGLTPTTPIQALLSGDLSELDLAKEALGEEYELIEELGRGGMAIVYLARERQLDREVAVKVLPLSLSFDKEFVERFEREARTAAGLEHPNIIPIYRVGQTGRISYFVMKLLRGRSLSDLMASRDRMPPDQIRRWLIEVAGALGHAAERGIVHRDVKPDNFIFDERGSCVVTDFGIAKAASSKRLTGTGMSIGTPHYMSPEQARAQDLDGRSDIYSLGIVAYQCLTGTVPYDGEDSFAIGYAHIMEPIPTPTLPTAGERELYRVIRQMMAKDPGDRYQTCHEVVEALTGETPALHPASLPAAGRPVPSITTQPTTPLPSVMTTGAAPGTGHGSGHITVTPSRRPVAKRSRAAPSQRSSTGWWVFLLLVLGGSGAGAAYYYQVGPFAQFGPETAGPGADSLLPPPALTVLDSTALDSGGTAPNGENPAAGDTTQTAAPPPAPTPVPRAVTPAVAPPSRDSGGIRIRGIPAGSAVLIDGEAVMSSLTLLPVGSHVLGITAPRHQFYADTIDIRKGQVMVYEPILLRLGQGGGRRQPIITWHQADCENPRDGYNRNNVCFDVRPRPVGPTFVTVPSDWTSLPQPSRLLIRVSASGRTLEVRSLRPSDRREFEVLARDYAVNIDWHPATKDGRAVPGWTPWEFRPVRP